MKAKDVQPKVVKGGFRATLALILSIIALIFSVMTYTRNQSQAAREAEIKMLRQKLEALKQETSERVQKMQQETAAALKQFGITIKKYETAPENQKKE